MYVPSLASVAHSAPPHWPAGVESIVEAAADSPVVLVPHSNSGLLVPSVVARLGERVHGVAFVDAALPGIGFYAQRAFLETLVADDGRLPEWTRWWDEADVAALFPDAETRRTVEAEQPRMPLAYYDEVPPAPDGWAVVPCGYLWFGEPYGAAALQAAANGWPTTQVPGGHLHMLFDPDGVADAVLELSAPW